LAEDNPTNQKVARRILERMGHRVDTAGNGLEAVEAVRLLPYDVVLMDVQMPDMDGLDATRAIRAMAPPRGAIPIVAMTANVLGDIAERCRAAGMNGYVAKPFRLRELVAALARWSDGQPFAPLADASATNAPVIDRLMIDELVDHMGSDDTAQVLGDAARALPERVRRVEEARANAATLARAAHDLASTAATAGLIELSSLGQRVERLCAEGDFQGAQSAARDAPAALARALAALDSAKVALTASGSPA
jgi:CheY-like chemotaxis protein